MVKCLSFCLIGAALLGSMIMTMLVSKKSKPFVTFMSLLDDNQQLYKKVILGKTIYNSSSLDNLINNMSLVFIDLYFLSTFEILSPKLKRLIFLLLTSLPKL